MRKQLLYTLALCGAFVALGAQAQTSPGSATDPATTPGSTPSTAPSTAPGTYNGSTDSKPGWSGRQISPTGRMSHEAVRGSQLTGALVTGSSGGEVGTISDTIIDPASGRLEFAVISISGNSAGDASSGSASSTTGISTTTPSGSVAGGKQVAVPWMLLRSSSTAGSSAASTTSSALQSPSFVFMGDNSKLQSAPNFDATTDLNQPSWRQSVFSFFGLSGRSSATGAAETPGSSSSSSGTSTPNSTSGNP